MSIDDGVGRFWRSMDGLFSDVHDTKWGAVVTDGRFPAIWDANYARIDVAAGGPSAVDVERELLPALERARCDTFRVVCFHPEAVTGLLTELSGRGHRLTWDIVMEVHRRPMKIPTTVRVQELTDDDELWEGVRASLEMFDTAGSSPGAIDQLQRIEREVLTPGGKRWFGVRDADGRVASLAALLMLGGVAYVDNVATLPEARRHGYASAMTAYVTRHAFEAGATCAFLLTDPDAPEVVRLYRKVGFKETGRLASTRGPVRATR